MVLQVERLQAHSRAFCLLYNVKEIHFVCCLPARVRPNRNGGGERIRTDALLLAKQALSRLSYTPNRIGTVLVGLGRFELPTSRLSGVRSNQAELQALDNNSTQALLGKLCQTRRDAKAAMRRSRRMYTPQHDCKS